MKYISVEEAAKRLGVSPRRVRALIKAGRLPAEKVARDWLIDKDDLLGVQDRKPGRPPERTEEKSTL